MAESFRFLSTVEFKRLTHAQKLAYLSDAMEELERSFARPGGPYALSAVPGWDLDRFKSINNRCGRA